MRPEQRPDNHLTDSPPRAAGGAAPTPAVDGDESPVHLFQPETAERFRVEWQQIQARFVDDPKDTEDLRLAPRGYRTFFNQLLDA